MKFKEYLQEENLAAEKEKIYQWLSTYGHKNKNGKDSNLDVHESFTVNDNLEIVINEVFWYSGWDNKNKLTELPYKFANADKRIYIANADIDSFKNFPNESTDDISIVACKNISSFDGDLKKVYSFSVQDCNITSLDGCPEVTGWYSMREKHSSYIGGPKHLTGHFHDQSREPTSIDGLPEVSKQIRIAGNNLKSLTGIHNSVKRCEEIKFNWINENFEGAVLGLLKIKDLKQVDVPSYNMKAYPDHFRKAMEIVNKHLTGDRDIPDCMDELMDAGLKEYAKL